MINTIQVKMSRAYYNLYSKYQGMLWYNRFEAQDNADLFILVGIYANCPKDVNASIKAFEWEQLC
ncbi:TPA: hypothetical protein PC612_000785 [Clostridioides difficile]|nr:hypothetical protein [Clostridioides difficile]